MPLVILPSNLEQMSEAELRKVADEALAQVLDQVVAGNGGGAARGG